MLNIPLTISFAVVFRYLIEAQSSSGILYLDGIFVLSFSSAIMIRDHSQYCFGKLGLK